MKREKKERATKEGREGKKREQIKRDKRERATEEGREGKKG